MRITKRQLRRIIKEAMEAGQSPGVWVDAAEQLSRGDSTSVTNGILNHYWMDDTWRQEEDALEDLLIDLGQNPTPEDVKAVAEEWLASYRAGKYRPQTKAEMDADWARGAKPRTDYGRKS